MPEAKAAIGKRQHVVLEDDLQGLVRNDLAVGQPADIRQDTNDAVRIVADKVGLDQVMPDALGFMLATAGCGKDRAHQPFQAVVTNVHRQWFFLC